MARIAGINIPPHKHAEIGLTAIYGIGRSTAQKICDATGVPYSRKIKDLTDADLEKIREEIGRITIEGDLRRDGPGLLPRLPSPSRPAGPRPAHPHQCPHPQGSAQVGRGQEVSSASARD
jgi:predicted ribosome quality control (RQC) complex YloA/Tae2 family protein